MRKTKFLIAVVAGLFLCRVGQCVADQVADLVQNHPERIDILFDHLNLDYPGLDAVKAAYQQGDAAAACRSLLEYYGQVVADGEWFRTASISGIDLMANSPVDEMMNDTFDFQGKGTVPRDENGFLDWKYAPNDDFQWNCFLNRQIYLGSLMAAWKETGNPAYAERVSADLKDWILHCPYDGKEEKHGKKISNIWTSLEAGSRSEVWAKIFYGLYSALDDDAKLLVLSSVPDHLDCLRKYHAKEGNHLAIEVRGLATMAGAFREFKESLPILDYAAGVMSDSLVDQVYPDGVQKELTAHYHGVAYRAFSSFAAVYNAIGQPLPAEFTDLVALMLDYTAYAQRPNGTGPMNNDSDMVFIRKNTLAVSDTSGREDWKYINSNGKEGIRPQRTSVFYPWAGQAVMRSGWDENAQWSFFDVGPWGIGHKHADKLHLSITAYGRDLLVDAGRYTYVGYYGGPEFPWRDYFISSVSHNTVLIDGAGQKPHTRAVGEPLKNTFLSTPDYDFCRGEYKEPYAGIDDSVKHTRAVVYLRDRYWLVVDRICSEKPHQAEVLWHYHPDCMVIQDGQSVVSTNSGTANLRIVPVSSKDWKIELVKGQEEPSIQGWYSPEYNKKVPGSVAVYETDVDKEAVFAWLLVADSENVPETPRVDILSESIDEMKLFVQFASGAGETVTVPLSGAISNLSVE